jgi:hypothetical protein
MCNNKQAVGGFTQETWTGLEVALFYVTITIKCRSCITTYNIVLECAAGVTGYMDLQVNLLIATDKVTPVPG